MTAIVALFFFVSGCTSLVLEVVWMRELAAIFGSSTQAAAAATGAFLGGLGLGGLLAARLADRLRGRLYVYAGLEAFIGVCALVMPLALAGLESFQHRLHAGLLYSPPLYAALRFSAVFLALAPPTIAMGATLPVLLSAVARREARIGRDAGLLYGVNSLGAVAGALTAGFVLLPTLGQTMTARLAAGVALSLALAVACAAWGLRLHERAPAPEPSPPRGKRPPRPYALLGLFLFALGLIGVVFQLAMTRVVGVVLGSSVYSFTLVVAVHIGGLALGSLVFAASERRPRDPYRLLALAQAATLAGVALATQSADRIPALLLAAAAHGWLTPAALFAVHAALTAALTLIPAVGLGMSFPLALRLFAGRLDEVGRSSGRGLFLNTLGSVVGAWLAAFVLIPGVGLERTMGLLALLALAWAMLFSAFEGPFFIRRRLWTALPAAALALAALALLPGWNAQALSAGYFRVAAAEKVAAHSATAAEGELLFYRDGVNATVTVERHGEVLTLKANGRPEASNRSDMPTQILAGLYPLLAHPKQPGGRAALIGYGSGVTAGAMLATAIDQLLIVEIEPAIVEAARQFNDVNGRPLADPRATLAVGDARSLLGYWPGRFDVIVSEPSNPWVAGSSSLFTLDFYRRMAGKLAPGGVYAQWVQLYELSPEHLAVLLRTFRAVFPHVQTLATAPRGYDLVLLGSAQPLPLDLAAIDGRLMGSTAEWAARAGLERASGMAAMVQIPDGALDAYIGPGPLNTDDNGLIEFAGPLDAMRHAEYHPALVAFHFDTDKLDVLPELTGLGETPEHKGRALAKVAFDLLLRGRVDAAARAADAASEWTDAPLPREVREAAYWIYAPQTAWPPVPDAWLLEEPRDELAEPLLLLLTAREWSEAFTLAFALRQRRATPDSRLELLLGALATRLERFDLAVTFLEPLTNDAAFLERHGMAWFFLGRALDRELQPGKAARALARWTAWAREHPDAAQPVDPVVDLEENPAVEPPGTAE